MTLINGSRPLCAFSGHKVYNGAVIWSGTIDPITDLYVASSNVTGTHQMIRSGGTITKASGPQTFSLTFPTSGDDAINGGAGADTINGKDGNDTITVSSIAEGAGDSIDGSTGSDTLFLVATPAEWKSLDASSKSVILDYVANPMGRTLSVADYIALSKAIEVATLTVDYADNDFVIARPNVAISISPLVNDSELEDLSIQTIDAPTNGQVFVANGTVTFTANEGFEGIDRFTYTAVDLFGVTSAATITVHVTNAYASITSGSSDPYLDTDANQVSFATLLIRQMEVYADSIVQYDEDGSTNFPSSPQAGNWDPDPNNPFLQGGQQNGPISEAELTQLQDLLARGNVNGQQRQTRDALLQRMSQNGVQFAGTDELRILDRILDAGQRGLRGNELGRFLGLYRQGLTLAVGGLQQIDEARYTQYRTQRWGGASHDDAWTFQNGGQTALRRYGIERLLHNSGATVTGWENRPRPQR